MCLVCKYEKKGNYKIAFSSIIKGYGYFLMFSFLIMLR